MEKVFMTKEQFAAVVTESAAVMYRVSKSILKLDCDCEDAVQEAGHSLRILKAIYTQK